MRHGTVVTILIGVLAEAPACDDDQPPTSTAPTTTTPRSDPEPTSLAIGGPDSLMVGATTQYQATITYSDGIREVGRGRGVGIALPASPARPAQARRT